MYEQKIKVKEVSKGMIGRYLKKVPASSADAGRKSSGAMGIGPEDQKKQMKAEVNIILDKINLHRFESLTEKEAEALKKAHSLFDK